MKKATRLSVVCALLITPAAVMAAPHFDGNWTTHLACEAHGGNPAYKWEFPSVIKDGNFHAQHGEADGPGYLVIDGKIADDGSAKLSAKGKVVTRQNAHGIFAMKGDNYSYTIKAQFTDVKGTGARDEGAGILGRPCTFEFDKQMDSAPAASPAASTPPAAQ